MSTSNQDFPLIKPTALAPIETVLLTLIIFTLTLVSSPNICAILGTSVADRQIPTASRAC